MQRAFAIIFSSVNSGACRERALVLQSRGLNTETLESEGRYHLLVPEEYVIDARKELADYESENSNWKPRVKVKTYPRYSAVPGMVVYVILMLAFAWAAGEKLFGYDWIYAGKVDAGLVLKGEWWRTFTALTLHADLGHLASNLGFGLLFGYFAGQFFGSGVGWLGILASGAIGNFANSYFQSASHTSVGASTAIFGALGLVAAYSWKRKLIPQDRWVGRVGPVVGGIALLAFTGTGGERTDVGAHLTGFVSGMMIGALYAKAPTMWLERSALQWFAGCSSVLIILLAWFFGLYAN